MSALPALGGASLAAGDVQSTRIVYAMVIGLALIGILFVLLGIWVIRQTRVDLEVFAPLERMGPRPSVDTEFEKPDRPVKSFDDLTEGGDPTPASGASLELDAGESEAPDGEPGSDAGNDVAADADADDNESAEVDAESDIDTEPDADTEPEVDASGEDVDEEESDGTSSSGATQPVEQ
ncbi:MAG: hypothetical protein IZT58_05520 [Actinobacteria bacterium]|nr:hypothetical protein [Actinomycetota bacterium]